MDFRLKVFISVAQNKSFTKAAKDLLISQPAVSKHIHELESLYNIALFERQKGDIKLTEAGKLLFSHAEKINDMYQRLQYEMNLLTENYSGELRIGASTSITQYVLPPILAHFTKKFPEIKLTIFNGNSLEIENLLHKGKISLGMVEGNSHQPSLHYQSFMKDELVLVSNNTGIYSKIEEIDVKDLKSMPLVLRENGSGTLDIIEAALLSRNIKLSDLQIVLQLGSTESIKNFIENSDALAIISIQGLMKELVNGQLKVIEINDLDLNRKFSFVYKQGNLGGLDESFINFTSRYLSSN
ncbi:LysR family transcriptional regulator [Marinilabiliaceae bacterium JC040]|nr:LysR family transcriptional regulator [Marinilabiliaceae bacterium JC040]